jgi:tripartite ATP-independent transporter DctP family solute receptor
MVCVLIFLAVGYGPTISTAATPQYTIRYSTQFGANSGYPAVVADQYLANGVAAATGGRVQLVLYYSGQLGGAQGTVTGVANGTIQMGEVSTSWMNNVAPHAAALSLPFLFKDALAASRVPGTTIGKLIEQESRQNGVRITGWYDMGFGQFATTTRQIKTMADMRGLKMRALDNPVELASWRAWGAIPVPLNSTEVFTALQSGTVQGLGIPIANLVADKYVEPLKYVAISNWEYYPAAIIANEQFFSRLPQDVQAVILRVAHEATVRDLILQQSADQEFTTQMQAQGVQFNTIAGDALAQFRTAVDPVYADAVTKYGPTLSELLRASH